MLDRIVIEPSYDEGGAAAPVGGLVVWLHGLGASGDDFVPLVPMLGLPWVRWVFPHAPARPVTINGGYVMPAWYDIRTLDHGPDRTTRPGHAREDVAGLHASADAVLELIQHEVDRGAPADRVVIAGFSQGGAVALDLLTRSSFRFRGGLALSTYLVTGAVDALAPTPANAQTPVFFGHGEADDVVPMWRGRDAHDRLAALGRPVAWEAYAMGHELCGREASDLRARLHAWLPPVADQRP